MLRRGNRSSQTPAPAGGPKKSSENAAPAFSSSSGSFGNKKPSPQNTSSRCKCFLCVFLLLGCMQGAVHWLHFTVYGSTSSDAVQHDSSSGNLNQEKTQLRTSALQNNEHLRSSAEATAAMNRVNSDYADGEKRLKAELSKLEALQKKGKCLGVQVSTKWMGENVPVWKCPEAEQDISTAKAAPAQGDLNDDSSSITFQSPAELAGSGAKVILEPTFGTHRSNVDAVLTFAQGYNLQNYILFIESLQNTGYEGDIVLSIASLSTLKPGVEEYLRSKKNVVVYAVEWTCFKRSGEPIPHPTAEAHCLINGMFGKENGDPIEDPRDRRPLATARYELYWAWSLRYNPLSALLLIDFRDTYYQLHPFEQIERSTKGSKDGLLMFFEENADKTISDSSFNSAWIREAYGQEVFKSIKSKPVICSGTTLGEQIAIEPYLRSMVLQFDKTRCKAKGCDQGFHNYIYYTHQLTNENGNGSSSVKGVREVKAYKQGKGVVNNLCLMREKPLKEWGLYKSETQTVLSWDGSVSPIVHQYDRDAELNRVMKERMKTLEKEWRGREK